MSTDLRRSLAELADESNDYTDAAAAVAAARRYRRRMVAVPVACVVAVTLVAAVVAATRPSRDAAPVEPVPDRTTAGPTELVKLALPKVVTAPTGAVPGLPANRAVGQGVLVYRPCPMTCPAYLVTVSGKTYEIDVPHVTPGVNTLRNQRQRDLEVSLSPDGRYLAISKGDHTTFRDLTGTAANDLPLENVVAWSPNDRYVANFEKKVDLSTGVVTPTRTAFSALTDDGQLLDTTTVDSRSIRVYPVEPGAGAGTVLDVSPAMNPGEAVFVVPDPQRDNSEKWYETAFGPGNVVAVTLFAQDPVLRRSAVAIGTDVTGTLGLRANLHPDGAVPFFLNDHVAYTTQLAPSTPIKVYSVSDDGGAVLLSQLPAGAEFFIAGMSGRYGATLGGAYEDPLRN